MGSFTPEERNAIEQNPLPRSPLDNIREALRLAIDTFSDPQSDRVDTSDNPSDSDNADTPERPKVFKAAMMQLFGICLTSPISLEVASRAGRGLLSSDLDIVRQRFYKDEFAYRYFRPLSQLIIQQAPDADIWASVITLIQAGSFLTPPPSALATIGTPITHSSASQQGSEQTRQKIEARVFEEIRYCTHRAVGGFHEKYFQGHKWDKRVNQLWKVAQSHYSASDKRWTQLPNRATENELCGWFLNLQQELLAKERAAYFKSTLNNKVGAEAQRQLDLFVKMRRGKAADARHDWGDVLVIGELKKSDQKHKALWLQIGSSVQNVFASQPTRLFVHAFTLTGTEMETWVFDRSGPYSGVTFDIHEEPKKFFQVICGYLLMSDGELGLDTFTNKQRDNSLSITIPAEDRRKKRKRTLRLDPNPIAFQRAIVCRGTSCFFAKAMGAADFDSVVKFSWTSSMRPPEADLLKKANERGVKGLAKLVGYHEEVTSISALRKDLVFAAPHRFRRIPSNANTSYSQSQPGSSLSLFPGPSIASLGHGKRKSTAEASNTSKRSRTSKYQPAEAERGDNEVPYPVQQLQGTSLVQQDHTPYDNRILRVLAISPAGRSISQFKSVIELLESLGDAIKVHRSLYLDGRILHRDISENNIIITDPGKADGFKGMLIDLDLAKEEGKGPSGARHRTGTMEFMAIEVLLGTSHTYRHDLESFFYVLIWLCARRGWALAKLQRPETSSCLLRWYTGTFEDIAQSKVGHMVKGSGKGLDLVLREFPPVFDCVKPLCRTLRDVLFPMRDELFTGTPQDPRILYNPIIKAFDDAVTELRR